MSKETPKLFRSKLTVVLDSVRCHGGGNSTAQTNPELIPELRPLFKQSGERMMGMQDAAPLEPFTDPYTKGTAGLSPYEQYGMDLTVGGEMPGALEAMAMQSIMRGPGYAAAGPTTGKADFSGDMDLASMTQMLAPQRGALGGRDGGIKGASGNLADQVPTQDMRENPRMPIETVGPRGDTRVVGPRGGPGPDGAPIAPMPGAPVPGGRQVGRPGTNPANDGDMRTSDEGYYNGQGGSVDYGEGGYFDENEPTNARRPGRPYDGTEGYGTPDRPSSPQGPYSPPNGPVGPDGYPGDAGAALRAQLRARGPSYGATNDPVHLDPNAPSKHFSEVQDPQGRYHTTGYPAQGSPGSVSPEQAQEWTQQRLADRAARTAGIEDQAIGVPSAESYNTPRNNAMSQAFEADRQAKLAQARVGARKPPPKKGK